MKRTGYQPITPESIGNARIAVSMIQRLGRGNHMKLRTGITPDKIEQVLVNEIGREILNSLGIATVTVGFNSTKHRYQVKLRGICSSNGLPMKDSLCAVLVNATFFTQAMAPALAKHLAAKRLSDGIRADVVAMVSAKKMA